MSVINTYLFIAMGGAIGACLRYFLTRESISYWETAFPLVLLRLMF